MIKFKKLAAAFVTIAAVAINGIGVIPVSADYDSCDVNRDGSVSSVDLILLNKYLNGQFSVSNYNQLDANKSLTVDAADSECISAKLLKYSYEAKYVSRNGAEADTEVEFPTVSGFTPNSTAINTNSLTYAKYSYEEQKQLERYTLTPTVSTLNTGVNSRTIIGTDDRYRADGEENTGIVCLTWDVDGYTHVGTGFIVGDHQIATAAHCIYDYEENVWHSIKVTMYGKDGELTDTTLTPVESHISSIYESVGLINYDYALITVEQDLSEYDCTYFSLGMPYNMTETDFYDVPIYVTGSPTVTQTTLGNNKLYSGEGIIIWQEQNIVNGRLHYNTDTSDGQSGAPVYTITKNIVGDNVYYTYTVFAIHSSGKKGEYNVGSLIGNHQLQFYHNNPNMNYITEN